MQLEYFFIKCVKGRTFSEDIRKKHNLRVYANYVQYELTPHWAVVLAKPLYHDSFRLSRKRLFALQRRYDSKGFKIATRQRCSPA